MPEGSVTVCSIASLMAIPSEPGVFGISLRMFLPAFVSLLGLATQFAPQTCIISFLKGFWSKLIRTIKTLHSRPMSWQAKASALPH